jgi:hypothetical protein
MEGLFFLVEKLYFALRSTVLLTDKFVVIDFQSVSRSNDLSP